MRWMWSFTLESYTDKQPSDPRTMMYVFSHEDINKMNTNYMFKLLFENIESIKNTESTEYKLEMARKRGAEGWKKSLKWIRDKTKNKQSTPYERAGRSRSLSSVSSTESSAPPTPLHRQVAIHYNPSTSSNNDQMSSNDDQTAPLRRLPAFNERVPSSMPNMYIKS